MSLKTLLITLIATLSGCATHLTLITTPPGGYIVEKGTGAVIGLAPASVSYDTAVLNNYRDENGCRVVNGVDVTWPSGAHYETANITLCGSDTNYNLVINRPNVEGLDKDLEFALKLESLRIQNQQLQEAQNANALQMYLNALDAGKSDTTHCRSRAIGESLYTDCY